METMFLLMALIVPAFWAVSLVSGIDLMFWRGNPLMEITVTGISVLGAGLFALSSPQDAASSPIDALAQLLFGAAALFIGAWTLMTVVRIWFWSLTTTRR